MSFNVSWRASARPVHLCAFSALVLWASEGRAQSPSQNTVSLPTVEVSGEAVSSPTIQPTPDAVTSAPAGQVQTTIGADRTSQTRAFSVGDLLIDSPGISVKQGNGPRDFGISIRGSNAQNGFGIRNIVVYDDGFPVTQPDGLSRSDLIDPHAYGAVNVIRGPSSALYGNYATGGAIDFLTRRGGAIDGFEIGADAGSYHYSDTYMAYGKKVDNAEGSIFASNEFGDALTSHSAYNTQTVNALLTIAITPEDRLTLKFIENHVHADLSNRLSLSQFTQNPYQLGCANAATGAPGCQTVSVFSNGFTGAKVPLSADQGGFGRNDNRAIAGIRYEHDFGSTATWRNQVTYDDRNINQPTGATSAIGDYPSINAMSDVTIRSQLFGFNASHYLGAFVNTISDVGPSINVIPGGNAQLGGLTQKVYATTTNFGARGREELALTDRLTFVAGLGVERTSLIGQSYAYAYSAPAVISSTTLVTTDRNIVNEAPEAALIYKPLDQLQLKGRIATGYGTPQVTNLFINQQGLAGNNTQLKSQTNLGYDLAAEWTPLPGIVLTVDGFYEFFRNELLSQSAGPSPLQSYTFNAPRSEHRGVEADANWHFLNGWTLHGAYSYDNQIYTQYMEQLSAGAFTNTFNRAGNRLPGVPDTNLVVRLGYDIPNGDFKGLGAYIEYVKQGSFYVDNANLLKAPAYDLLNANLHYTHEIQDSWIKSVSAYFEVRNITNETYVASANNITDTISAVNGAQSPASAVAATTGSIYAGTPRTFVGGVKLKF
jgi:iron complex outermembrane receptor protein